ncbi:MAG: Gar1/Naf1 family protein [Candidatus Hermodarchaeota archaeon]|jgi:rRNA processing protein Gar1|nr:Gar1/Naf1 family protein [Candidatus Hermodarchaeota archaeon]
MFLSNGLFLTFYSHHDLILAFPGVDLLQGIGHVLHFSAQGYIILRLTQVVRLGTRVFSTNSRPIGRVVDIFGPTSQPFAALKPETKITEAAIPPGTNLFLMKAPKGGVGKRRKK